MPSAQSLSLRARLGVPTRLRDLGVQRERLGHIAEMVMHERGLYFNPRAVARASELEPLLDSVW